MAQKAPPGREPKEREPLTESVTPTVEEARMLIPGVAAFLGFQLVAVFNNAFSRKLTPAAYHRQAESGWVSQGFVNCRRGSSPAPRRSSRSG
jgi:hypothetical protein